MAIAIVIAMTITINDDDHSRKINKDNNNNNIYNTTTMIRTITGLKKSTEPYVPPYYGPAMLTVFL